MSARENGAANHGSGRPKSERVPHEKRPQHYGMSHVIYRLKPGMESLRRPKVLRVLEGAFRAAKRKGGFRLIAYSLQDTHIHMIVEGQDAEVVSRGMQGLGVRLTKQLNRVWGRRGGGTVFRERFKQVTLRGYKQITAALNYVLNNALKHWCKPVDGRPDRYSSAAWYPLMVERFRRPLRRSPVELTRFMVSLPLLSVCDRPGDGRLALPIGRVTCRAERVVLMRRKRERALLSSA
jgi:REP element-mobilizing transposase RayT